MRPRNVFSKSPVANILKKKIQNTKNRKIILFFFEV